MKYTTTNPRLEYYYYENSTYTCRLLVDYEDRQYFAEGISLEVETDKGNKNGSD